MLGKSFLFALIVEILKWIWYFVSLEFLRKCSVDPWKCLNAGQAPQIFHFTKNRKDFVFEIQQSEQKFVIRHAHTFELRTSFTLMEASQVSKALSVSFFFLFCSHNAQPQSKVDVAVHTIQSVVVHVYKQQGGAYKHWWVFTKTYDVTSHAIACV